MFKYIFYKKRFKENYKIGLKIYFLIYNNGQ